MNKATRFIHQNGKFLTRLLIVFLLLLILLAVAFWFEKTPTDSVDSNSEAASSQQSSQSVSGVEEDATSSENQKEDHQKEDQQQSTTSVTTEPESSLPVNRTDPERHNLPAFPGAQGDGADSRGGRGGKVLIVNRLDDPCPTEACTADDLADPVKATPGTLRWALIQNFPRTVVFSVSGVIRLQEDLVEQVDGKLHIKRLAEIRVRHPYLTVAGQSAPAGGITIANNGISIFTHDVILRYLRFRTGRGTRPVFSGQQNPQTLMIQNQARRVIVDHCSFSWMPAEGVSVYTGELWDGSKGSARDITLSWNIIGEGLVRHKDGRGHPNAGFMSGFDGDPKYAARNLTLHHNLLLHTQKRNGDLLNHNGRLINNLIFNWQWLPTVMGGGVQADLIANVWKPGPLSQAMSNEPAAVHLVPSDLDLGKKDPDGWWHAVTGEPSLYLADNAYGKAGSIPDEQSKLLCYYQKRDGKCDNAKIKANWLRKQAAPAAVFPVTVLSPADAEQAILTEAGASQRINYKGQWVSNRDGVDVRFVEDYRNAEYSQKKLPFHEEDTGGYPTQVEGAPYPDQDKDGMSDIWEVAHRLNPDDPDDANTVPENGKGYTHLEIFLNGIDWQP